ncbi:hypothetical protein AX774_g7754 [Zancudomyces culisetae]|uniref:Uncharacterized protein n=1 Tax=Zancudomyces culisetae TaxID=1213189 RepID=A0A1R1PD33_ZANCU|nr:hypothetical protein AX774_g7754 [Zancudomyces culisetae]|eukprot:OMH78848.1 hypothetical protein AX774_g7754 [Zancudomyces culisetae]
MNNDPTLTDPSTTTGHSLLLNENESIFNFETIPLSTTFSSRLNKRKAKSISDDEAADSTQNKSHTNKSNNFTENLAPNHSFAENLTR